MPAVATPTLSTHNLGCQRGERPLFRGLNLTVEPGSIVWLRGRNGCGKTSLLRLLAGLASAAQGSVMLGGQPLAKLDAAWRASLVYIAHTNGLKDDLTVAESLRFLGCLRSRVPTEQQIDDALARVGMQALRNAMVRTLSQGQRRRSSLARLALPQPPAICLLDEPFDALDVHGITALNQLLVQHRDMGGSLVLTSHQPLDEPMLRPVILDLDAYAVRSLNQVTASA